MSIPALHQIFAVEVVYLRYCSCFKKIFVALSVFTQLIGYYCVLGAVASPIEIFVGAHVQWGMESLIRGRAFDESFESLVSGLSCYR